ncbi:hypothetical protein ACPC54_19490 [Kitasatospora sp. NPDC094028]
MQTLQKTRTIGPRTHRTEDESPNGELTTTHVRWINGTPYRFTHFEYRSGDVFITVESPVEYDLRLMRILTGYADLPHVWHWTFVRQLTSYTFE